MVDILAFGAHPDDIELGCGGLLAKSAAQGYSILLVDLTKGDKATNGTPEIRQKEGEAAAAVIGAKRLFLDFKDCEIVDNIQSRLKLVQVIRENKPRLVLAPMWKGEQNHPDHIACGGMARYACRYARFSKLLPEIPVHTPEGILHYLPQAGGKADILVDVSGYVNTWKEMMNAHKSQLETYPYMDWMLRSAAALGGMIGTSYAQGFVVGNPIVVDDIMTVSHSPREI